MEVNENQTPQETPARKSSLKQRLILLGAIVFVLGYSSLLAFHFSRTSKPMEENLPAGLAFMEKCRQICLSYGLLPTGHLANDAKAYLEVAKPQDLSTDLKTILGDREFVVAKPQELALLNKSAPEFSLNDTQGKSQSLAALRGNGPIVVVFYYGYRCSHCVAQLFGLDKDLRHFQELGCPIVAISADKSEYTKEQYAKYGEFHFPVLSDPENKIATQYGVFVPATGDKDELLDHGTFVIDATGKVIWGNQGPQPFLDNKSLLFVVSALKSKGPPTTKGGAKEGQTAQVNRQKAANAP